MSRRLFLITRLVLVLAGAPVLLLTGLRPPVLKFILIKTSISVLLRKISTGLVLTATLGLVSILWKTLVVTAVLLVLILLWLIRCPVL